MKHLLRKLHIDRSSDTNATDPNRSNEISPPLSSSHVKSADYISREEQFQRQLALAISSLSDSNSNSEFKGNNDIDKDQIRAATLPSLTPINNNIRINSRRDGIDSDSPESLSRPYWIVDNGIVRPKFSPAFDESLPEESFPEDNLNGKVIETVKVVDVLKERTHGSSNSIESKLGELERKKIQKYSSEDLTSITKNFIDLIGSGAYGDVFKGKLPDGVQVAVKKLKDIAMNVMENTFMAEVGTMSRTSHRNLVRLYGYCFEVSMKALVYEYLENGSLDKVLYENYLSWENLYDIAIGTAVGLSYLHEGCNDVIVHYDVKPGNVLFDSKLSPKVADFGMAKISQRDLCHISVIEFRGTRSYAAPEMWMQMSVTVKSDIYSFGMMLFEILGRKRNLDGQNWLPGQVWEKFEKEKLNEIMEECGIEDKNKVKAKKLCTVALWCT